MSSDAEGRINVYELTTNAVKDSPWTGFGYGTFREGFRLYRSEETAGVFEKTHNTYIENSFEMGIPAVASLMLALISIAFITARGVFKRRRDWLYPATGFAAITLVAIHSFVDFSLQIPAVAIVFSAIMGTALAQATSSNTINPPLPPGRRQGSRW
jgi:O-antigen ligase